MDKIIILILVLSSNFLWVNGQLRESSSHLSLILKSYEEKNYDKNVRPNYGRGAVIINVSLFIKDIISVSEAQMELTSDIYFRQMWTDERLSFNISDVQNVLIGEEFARKLWLPDTFFMNSKQILLHSSTNFQNNVMMKINSNGDIFYSVRYTIVSICQMDLKYLPMDIQICPIEIQSYGSNDNEQVYHFIKQRVLADTNSLSNFRVLGYFRKKIEQNITHLSTRDTNVSWSKLSYGIVLSRSIGYYINQVYIPALMIVIISWIPFWLERDDNHARVGLGVTTVLTMTTLVTNTNQSMPKISYMKSLDIYLEVCFAMVFTSLIQYAVVGYNSSKSNNKILDLNQKETIFKTQTMESTGLNPRRIDFHSRWIFPLAFISFNIFYWFTFISLSRVPIDDMIPNNL